MSTSDVRQTSVEPIEARQSSIQGRPQSEGICSAGSCPHCGCAFRKPSDVFGHRCAAMQEAMERHALDLTDDEVRALAWAARQGAAKLRAEGWADMARNADILDSAHMTASWTLERAISDVPPLRAYNGHCAHPDGRHG
jgi:hypothetical protein